MMSTANVLSLETVLVQRPGNIASDMDGEKVMLNIQNGKYYNLGEVGGEIWSAIAQPAPVSRIVEVIRQTFEVPAETAERDVFEFVYSLLAEDLVAIASAS
ncbi:metallophosphoesterase [Paenibacillus sp. FSL R7-0273]|uniref:lasso peptide biosynthesis PqqD family chaperone n=2 Tax=Paenibacillus sp. FSL R7-0273 TaxID=1536772 RepID=UPI0004F79EAA|nr:lasso peptide biosynthesis PqqD family chaperone [Paenibacillus sp. FSL R7-0273]AIQ45093.1 metallophosphoesterase [Paenibacillus sp. FSL R7-0273]OMF84617.1 metallophosphoesterase [Paenibacillus sp. FSL R7-0273]